MLPLDGAVNWDQLYHVHHGDLLGAARRRLGDRRLAEEAVGETWLAAFRWVQLHGRPDVGAEGRWLRGLLRCVIAKVYDAEHRQQLGVLMLTEAERPRRTAGELADRIGRPRCQRPGCTTFCGRSPSKKSGGTWGAKYCSLKCCYAHRRTRLK